MNKRLDLSTLTGYASIDKPQNRGYSYFDRNPMVPSLNIYSAIKLLNQFYGNIDAIDCLDITVNYKNMLDDAVTLSLALKELGINKGDIITISMPNFYQAVISFLACNRIGAVTTFLNDYASNDELVSYLNLFESPILINYNKTLKENEIIKKKTNVKHVVTLKKERVNSLNIMNDYHKVESDVTIDFNTMGSIAEFQRGRLEKYHSSKENALILFTSGTTGKPKSVVLTNENILAAGTYLKKSSDIKNNHDKRTLVCVPFTYPYGFGTSTLMTLLSNKTAILAPNLSKETISYYLRKNPNIIFGSPALLELIMRNVPDSQDLSSIKQFISGGDFLTAATNERGVEYFKRHNAFVEIGNGSGNAETVSCGTNPLGVKNRPETAGKILVGTDAMIVDPDTMKEKKYGEVGLLCVSGKHVFKEYYKEPELTKNAKFQRNNKTYFKTGTLGFIDDEGYFTITGRESRFYIMSSLNKVYCDYVQNIICEIPHIIDCAVVKVPDDDMLFVNKAYIVLEKNYDDDYIRKFINEKIREPIKQRNGDIVQLKKYEIPTYLEFVETLPRKFGTEKIDYQLLEEDAKKEVNSRIKKRVKTKD